MSNLEKQIISRLHTLGIEELKQVTHLNELKGDFVNLFCELPNGKKARLLDDDAIYLGCEICKKDSERCYGVAANKTQIAVYEYGDAGKDGVLVAWIRMD